MDITQAGRNVRGVLQALSFGGEVILAEDTAYAGAARLERDRRPQASGHRCLPFDPRRGRHGMRRPRGGLPLSVRGGGHQVAGLSVCDGGGGGGPGRDARRRVSTARHPPTRRGGCLLGRRGPGDGETGPDRPRRSRLPHRTRRPRTRRRLRLDLPQLRPDLRQHSEARRWSPPTARIDEAGQRTDEDSDLLWALRGGGGNFGVVTRVRAHPTHARPSTSCSARRCSCCTTCPRAVGHYADAMADAPDGLSAICIIRLAPPMPGMPTDLIGEPIVIVQRGLVGRPRPTAGGTCGGSSRQAARWQARSSACRT